MEISKLVGGIGVIILTLVGFGLFYENGKTNYGVTGEDLLDYDSEEYSSLVNDDTTDLINSDLEDVGILGGIWLGGVIAIKQLLNFKWLGLIIGLIGKTLGSLPIPVELTVIIISMIVSAIVYAIIKAILGRNKI